MFSIPFFQLMGLRELLSTAAKFHRLDIMAKLTYTREKLLKISTRLNLIKAVEDAAHYEELYLYGSWQGAFLTWTLEVLALKNEKLTKAMARMEKILCTKQ